MGTGESGGGGEGDWRSFEKAKGWRIRDGRAGRKEDMTSGC